MKIDEEEYTTDTYLNEETVNNIVTLIEGETSKVTNTEEEIDKLLSDIQIPVSVRTTLTSGEDNILKISNYTQFLLLQSRLTGVPLDVLATDIESEDDNDDLNPINSTQDQQDYDDQDNPDEEYSDLLDQDLDLLDSDFNPDLLDLDTDLDLLDSDSNQDLSDQDFNQDEYFFNDINEEDIDCTYNQDSHLDEYYEVNPSDDFFDEIEDEDILTPTDLDFDNQSELTDEDNGTSNLFENKESVEVSNIGKEENEDEPLETLDMDSCSFDMNNFKVNSSKTYSLKTLDIEVGGNYNV